MSEQDQWQSRRLTQRKKTETLGMDELVEIGSASTDPIPQPREDIDSAGLNARFGVGE